MKTGITLRREAGHGGIIPRGWQMAWYEPLRRVGVYYPSPLQRLADEYARGYLAGWRECYRACLDVMEEEIARTDDVWEIGALLTGTPKVSQEN